ncbi:protein-L-isoaspartate O-methyltransferase family protein [Hydrogenophaga sp. OTU3427]|uniref:protein-L-isoaspartate O-methyltransferase family protein n=1 Tax=Hydrogenophaga sp. OTU3427 TaxID=3043856 RepID=UPI00313D9DBC
MTALPSTFDIEQARFNMIEQQVRPWDVLDPQVLALLGEVKREHYAPEAHQALAFVDMDIPLTQPAVEGQCMLSPRVEARMVQDLQLAPTDKVLEIGTGSGYSAALMARLAQQVLSLEIEPALASRARTRLMQAGVKNVDVRQADAAADGFAACKTAAPFDAILLSGSVAEVPQALMNLLAVGGRLIAITGDEPMMRATLVTRVSDAAFQTTQPWDTVAPRLLNFPQPSRFHF